ncbi:MAG: hypothetical protein VKN33_03050 [Candidatus Sericytochromatia bacterium]|nr:hypothetical protein [Candidatus Sericytochromatia bacterium]
MVLPHTERVEELRQSAEQLAKQALDTAELGLRLVREQFNVSAIPQPPQVTEIHRNIQDSALAAETKAKELFTLATQFLNELNDKWQPGGVNEGTGRTTEPPQARVRVDID